MSFFKQLFRKRNLQDLLREAEEHPRLRRILDTKQLTYNGIGAIIGTGIWPSRLFAVPC